MPGVKPVKHKKILILQKHALRLIHFVNFGENVIPLFIAENIIPINFLYFESITNLMYDVSCANAPENICNLFMSINKIHPCNTQASTSINLFINSTRTNIQKQSFSFVGVHIWNQIPQNIRNSSKRIFKKAIKEHLFNYLSDYGYNAEGTNIFKFYPFGTPSRD